VQSAVDREVEAYLSQKLDLLEKLLKADVLAFFGPLIRGVDDMFKQHIEDIKQKSRKKHLTIILTTLGGGAETVERIVNTLRHHYTEVSFLVPDYAYSAGTILCMSGDNIYMNYFSVLGPIDPQVQRRDGGLVPARGYLDKVNEMIAKSKKSRLTDAEFVMLKNMDLADLRSYEKAQELTVDLLKKWLVKYKFKNWNKHSSNNSLVTIADKELRAKEIAEELGNTSVWHTHSRPINLQELRRIKLKIEDYGDKPELNLLIEQYYSVMKDYITKYRLDILFHTKLSLDHRRFQHG